MRAKSKKTRLMHANVACRATFRRAGSRLQYPFFSFPFSVLLSPGVGILLCEYKAEFGDWRWGRHAAFMCNWACQTNTCWVPSPLLGCQLLSLLRPMRIYKSIFSSAARYPRQRNKMSVQCKQEGRKPQHILPLHELKDRGLGGRWGGGRNHFWITPPYTANPIQLQRSILHPFHATLALQIHQNRLHAFSTK